jgi:predicted outer membrane repeat protein
MIKRFVGLIVMVVILLSVTRALAVPVTIGTGTATSCTEAALNSALVQGSVEITFNCGPTGATINFTTTKTIGAGITVSITGATSRNIIFSGQDARQLFVVDGTATFVGLTMRNGRAPTGGAILLNPAARMIVDNVLLTSNFASGTSTTTGVPNGGAIYNNQGNLVVANSTFEANGATGGSGGAISNNGGNTVIEGTTFLRNTSTRGGATYNNGGVLRISTNSTFEENFTTPNGNGGAIAGEDSVQLNIEASTFRSNRAENGGAIVLFNGVRTDNVIRNSSFIRNSAIHNGGAIKVDDSSSPAINVTLDGLRMLYNTAGLSGGAINIGGTNLTLNASQLRYNRSMEGAALYMSGINTRLNITDSRLDSNVPLTATGSDILAIVQANVTLTGVELRNSSRAAIISDAPTTIRNTNFFINRAPSVFRRDVLIEDSGFALNGNGVLRFIRLTPTTPQTVTINRSTFFLNGNPATKALTDVYGVGIVDAYAASTLTLNRVRFGWNFAFVMVDAAPTTTLVNTLFWRNRVSGTDRSGATGGTLAASPRVTTLNLFLSTMMDVYPNNAPTIWGRMNATAAGMVIQAPTPCAAGMTFTVVGRNFQFPGNTCPAFTVVNPQLDGLTGRPLLTSPVLNVQPTANCGNPREDIDGTVRPQGPLCDAGAFEGGIAARGSVLTEPIFTPTPAAPPAPVIRNPVSCGNFRPTSPLDGLTNGQVVFYWDPAQGAQGYRLNIYNDQDSLLRTFDIAGQNTAFSADISSNAIGGGDRLRWEVQALYEGRVACTASTPLLTRGAVPSSYVPSCGNGIQDPGEEEVVCLTACTVVNNCPNGF